MSSSFKMFGKFQFEIFCTDFYVHTKNINNARNNNNNKKNTKLNEEPILKMEFYFSCFCFMKKKSFLKCIHTNFFAIIFLSLIKCLILHSIRSCCCCYCHIAIFIYYFVVNQHLMEKKNTTHICIYRVFRF